MKTKKKEQVDLTLFVGFPEEYLEKDGVASALQSFETAIYCIALRRWPATIGLIWQANELLLHCLYEESLKTWSNIDAMKMHMKKGNITAGLNDAAHKLRKTRNDFVHSGFSPKDDYLSIRRYFEAGVPYFANLFKTAFERELYDTEPWFWDLYKKTRKLITSPDSGEENFNRRTWLFVLACHKIVTVGGRFENNFFPYNLYEDHMRNNHPDIQHDFDIEIIKEYIDKSMRSSPDVAWLGISCKCCDSELMGDCVLGDKDLIEKLNGFGCAKCDYVFTDPKEIECLIDDRVFRNRNTKEVTFVEDRMYFI